MGALVQWMIIGAIIIGMLRYGSQAAQLLATLFSGLIGESRVLSAAPGS